MAAAVCRYARVEFSGLRADAPDAAGRGIFALPRAEAACGRAENGDGCGRGIVRCCSR